MIKKIISNIRKFFTFDWLLKVLMIDCVVPKIIKIGGKKIDVSDFYAFYINGDGLEKWNVHDNQTAYVKLFESVEDCYSIENKPLVVVKESNKRFYESKFSVRKFITYFDLKPEKKQSLMDTDSWDLFYNRHYVEFSDLNRTIWFDMCSAMEKLVLTDDNYKDVDVHKMALVAVKYGIENTNYYLIPSEHIVGEIKYIL